MATISFKPKSQIEQESLESKRNSMVVSKFQAKAALKSAGRLKEVRTYMKSLEEDDLIRIAWDDAQEFKRMSPTVLGMAQLLQMTEEDLDMLFEQAKTIKA